MHTNSLYLLDFVFQIQFVIPGGKSRSSDAFSLFLFNLGLSKLLGGHILLLNPFCLLLLFEIKQEVFALTIEPHLEVVIHEADLFRSFEMQNIAQGAGFEL